MAFLIGGTILAVMKGLWETKRQLHELYLCANIVTGFEHQLSFKDNAIGFLHPSVEDELDYTRSLNGDRNWWAMFQIVIVKCISTTEDMWKLLSEDTDFVYWQTKQIFGYGVQLYVILCLNFLNQKI